MIDLNLHGTSQKEKTFFRQDNRINRISKINLLKDPVNPVILSKGFNVSYVYPSFYCFRQKREKKVFISYCRKKDIMIFH
jgi:hypothetical protein